jgi:4-diphosphocytidyl-2-C-methyl-D-erythritol kinase
MPLARAKVNLWLRVVGRRADGYHLLDSLVAFTDLADSLDAAPSDALSLAVDGPGAPSLGRDTDNLVLKAARLLAARARVAPRAAIRLTKRIPVAAGLGGGSADAAAALRALADLWGVALPVEELFDQAATLGADVPMCLAGRAALASGVGEKLMPVPPLPACGLLLVNPGKALATGDVFAARRGDFSQPQPLAHPWSDLASLVEALAARGNDLTAAATALCPPIGEVLAFLHQSSGVRYAAMSGSGATCFALYDTPTGAKRVAVKLPAGWWRHAGVLIS